MEPSLNHEGVASGPAPGSAWLDVIDGQGRRRRHELDASPVLIGRSSAADLRLDHGTVSRRHAQLTRDGAGRWLLSDMGSRNGTLVAGAPAHNHPLTHGEPFVIGAFEVVFHSGARRDEDPATALAPVA